MRGVWQETLMNKQLGEQQVLSQGQNSRMKLMLEVHQVF